ncbi:MAG: pantetheine-phosphate adenylyltransferase [Clostridia bacterium]|jgi:pantetheine-phosphate adenylyltransferase
MKILVFPGSFDPLTNGHIDIIERSLKICDKLVIAVFTNVAKKPFFTVEERMKIIKEAVRKYNNIDVDSFSGTLSDYVEMKNANAVIKGLRSIVDYEYETQMALINKCLNSDFETLLMISDEKDSYISSSAVKDIALNGGNVEKFVPAVVAEAIKNKLK